MRRWWIAIAVGFIASCVEFSSRRAINWHVGAAFFAGALVGTWIVYFDRLPKGGA